MEIPNLGIYRPFRGHTALESSFIMSLSVTASNGCSVHCCAYGGIDLGTQGLVELCHFELSWFRVFYKQKQKVVSYLISI